MVNSSSNNVSAYSINATTGALYASQGVAIPSGQATLSRSSGSNGQVPLHSERQLQRCFWLFHQPDERRTDASQRVTIRRGQRRGTPGHRSRSCGQVRLLTNVGTFSVSAYSINANGALKLKGSPVGAGSHPIGVATCGVRPVNAFRPLSSLRVLVTQGCSNSTDAGLRELIQFERRGDLRSRRSAISRAA